MPDLFAPLRPTRPWYRRKRFVIPISVFAGLILIGSLSSVLQRGFKDGIAAGDVSATPTVAQTAKAGQAELPSVVGMTKAQATAALAKVGLGITPFNPEGSVMPGDTATGYASFKMGDFVPKGAHIWVYFKSAAPSKPDGTTDSAASQQPDYTVAQENAIRKAQSYIDVMAFSRAGLIHQLEFDQFSAADATFGVDYLGVDWNDQAVAKAKEYLSVMSFSHGALVDQLVFDGFTRTQAEHGASGAGL